MRLDEATTVGRLLQGDPMVSIDRVVYDSRAAGPGSLFVAVPGFQTDGHAYVADAVGRGAVAVVVERPVAVPPHLPVLQVDSARKALGELAARLYGWPSRHLRVIGVTGTNGKTTTTHLIRSILMEQGHRVGLIGTVHNYIDREELPACLTTPQASDVQELMHRMVNAGCTYVVMEASSEGLDMHRVDHVEFDLGVFTNLTRDHLNYHGTFERYREAKLALFRALGRPGAKQAKAAVLNADDPSTPDFEAVCTPPVHWYGMTPRAQVRAVGVEVSASGSRFALQTPRGSMPLRLRLAGQFNVYNALAAAATCLHEGVELPVIARALESMSGVSGRMEAVSAGQPFGLFVDYAHSPDGLLNILSTARGFARGRVILVFGCGGDRDRTKRPEMGRIASELADMTILTSDNPRSEEPEAIIREIEAGMAPGSLYEAVTDREQAIARAIALAQPQDVVIIAGKGHETYQIFRDRTIEFDDRAVAHRLVTARIQERMEPE